MPDVFISYAREDRGRAEQVARGLGALGLEAFWDTDIPPGQTWADYIEAKLAQCKAVVVLWSQHSTQSQWVREEARMGRDKAKLIPAQLDGSAPPFGFGEVQAADLSAWGGEPAHPGWERFSRAVFAAVRGADAPMPQAQQTQWQPQQQFAQASWSAPAGAAPASVEQLSPIGYISKCLANYANGKGRARRSEFGWFMLFAYVVLFIGAVVDALSGVNYAGAPNDNYIVAGVLALALLCPMIAVASRRAHDFGQSGWLAVLTAIPYIGVIATLVFVFVPSQSGANQYGPNPKRL